MGVAVNVTGGDVGQTGFSVTVIVTLTNGVTVIVDVEVDLQLLGAGPVAVAV